MKNIIFLLILISTVTLAQNKIIRQTDLDTTLTNYQDTVRAIVSDSLSGVSIGNADSLGSVAAIDYLTWSDTTSNIATQYDLTQITSGALADSIDTLRVDITSNTASISTNATDISTLETLANNKFYLGNGSNVATEVTLSGDVTSSNDGTMAIASGVIVNADVNANAAIDATKVHDGTISNTEFGYLNGVSSNLQTQIDNLEVGTLSSLTDGTILIGDVTNEAAERTLSGDVTVSNLGVTAIGSGVIVDADINNSAAITATKIGAGSVDNTEFGYINGLTSAAQTQLTTNAGNIATNVTNISANGDSVTAIRTDVNTNTGNVTTNTSNIATNSSDIDDLEALASGKIYMGNGSNVAAEVTPSGDVTMSTAGVNSITAGAIIDADVNASANIDASKLGTGVVSNTELNYLNNVTGAIQTQFTEHTDSNTAQRTDINALETLADGKVYIGNSSNVATEITLSGDATVTNAGVVAIASGVIVNADINASANIDATKLGTGVVSNTELNYLNGVTSAIQTQIDGIVVTDTIKARGSSWDWTLLSPQPSEEILLKRIQRASTLDSVVVTLVGSSTPSVTFNLWHGGNAMFSGNQTADEYTSTTIGDIAADGTYNSYTSFSDDTMVANDYLHLEIGTVSGTVNQMFISVYYTED